jgi:predicted choloylglycine hydrolase
MHKPTFKGKHYDIGYRQGSFIFKKGIRMEPYFNLTLEKREFGIECINQCATVFPEVLEEIKGLADGMKVSYHDFASFIFCMYCFEFVNWCTCLAFKDDNNIVFGRNSDFAVSIEDQYESAFYNLESGYSFIGNSTAMVQMEDGVNEHGLATGLTLVNMEVTKPGLNAGILVRYLLEKCKTVTEALEHLAKLPMASAQTLTIVDKTGDVVVVECNREKTTIIRPRSNENFIVATNHYISSEMQQYQHNEELYAEYRSKDRYQTAFNTLKTKSNFSLGLAKDILSGKHGFMCQYDRSKGFDTVWSSVYDIKNHKIYRAEGNPSRVRFKSDNRLQFKVE